MTTISITLTDREQALLLANERNDHESWPDIGRKIRDAHADADRVALDRIAVMLRDPDCGVGMLEDIAEITAGTGRDLDGDGSPTWARH